MALEEYTTTGYFDSWAESNTGKDDWTDPEASCDEDWNVDAVFTRGGGPGVEFSETVTLSELDTTRTIGRITKIELIVKYEMAGLGVFKDLYVRPYYDGAAGDSISMLTYGLSGTEYIDITEDTNAPANWQWSDLEDLTVKFYAMTDTFGDTVSCYEIAIRVTYTLEAYINIGDAWKEVVDIKINIGDSWESVTDAKINIGDVWKDLIS